MLFTLLIGEHSVQDIANVATAKKKRFDNIFAGWLMTEERDGRSVTDGVEVSGRKRVNGVQHLMRRIGDMLSTGGNE